MVHTWPLKGVLYPYFGVYVCTVKILGPFGTSIPDKMPPSCRSGQTRSRSTSSCRPSTSPGKRRLLYGKIEMYAHVCNKQLTDVYRCIHIRQMYPCIYIHICVYTHINKCRSGIHTHGSVNSSPYSRVNSFIWLGARPLGSQRLGIRTRPVMLNASHSCTSLVLFLQPPPSYIAGVQKPLARISGHVKGNLKTGSAPELIGLRSSSSFELLTRHIRLK